MKKYWFAILVLIILLVGVASSICLVFDLTPQPITRLILDTVGEVAFLLIMVVIGANAGVKVACEEMIKWRIQSDKVVEEKLDKEVKRMKRMMMDEYESE